MKQYWLHYQYSHGVVQRFFGSGEELVGFSYPPLTFDTCEVFILMGSQIPRSIPGPTRSGPLSFNKNFLLYFLYKLFYYSKGLKVYKRDGLRMAFLGFNNPLRRIGSAIHSGTNWGGGPIAKSGEINHKKV